VLASRVVRVPDEDSGDRMRLLTMYVWCIGVDWFNKLVILHATPLGKL
jgi:hypothetical protein